ncbi:MAG: zinc ribbon domain-containing protein [Clostridiaceae bacterium]
MFCEKCGAKGLSDAKFCEKCGAPMATGSFEETGLDESLAEPSEPTNQRIAQIDEAMESQDPERVRTDSSQKKHQSSSSTENLRNSREWLYEFSLWKNPTILISTAKVLLIGLSAPTLLMFFLTLSEEGIEEALRVTISILGIGLGIMAVLLLLGYVLTGLLQGGKYIVLFQMDDQGVNHIQLQSQYKKAQAMGFLTALAGVFSGNLTTAGAGLMSATKRNLYTSFRKVKSIKIARSRHTIYLNEGMVKNQIYASSQDFDGILEHVLARCPKDVRVLGK